MQLTRPSLMLLFSFTWTVACNPDLSSEGARGNTGGASGSSTSSTSTSSASTSGSSSATGTGTSGSGGSAGSASTSGSGGADSDASSPTASAVAAGGASVQGAGGGTSGAGGGVGGASSEAGSMNPRDAAGDTTVPPGGYGTGPITECSTPSLDRLQQWTAHANTTPGSGNLLVKEGARYVAKVSFPGGGAWSEVVVPVNNNETIPGDLSKSAGFTITYSATAEFWGQLRGTVQAHGGDQNVVRLPATAGNMSTLSFRFVQDDWTFVPGLGKPTVTLASVLPSAVFFDFVGNTANTIAFYDLRFDNYLPQCR